MQRGPHLTFRDKVRIAIALIVSALAAYGAMKLSFQPPFELDQYFDTQKLYRSNLAEEGSFTIGVATFFVALASCVAGRATGS
jgi:hypothetical protein